jgi:hypothetical protein
MGKRNSKNVSGQHRVLMSFYVLMGFVDWLEMIAFFILILVTVQSHDAGEEWHVVIPIIALFAHYYINYRWIKLWDLMDPPKPDDIDDLTQEECRRINNCDQYFDRWNEKYFDTAQSVRRIVALVTHKMFLLPYCHFYGYGHFTVRAQKYFVKWEWDIKDLKKHYTKDKQAYIQKETFRFHGRLVDRLDGHNRRYDCEDHESLVQPEYIQSQKV